MLVLRRAGGGREMLAEQLWIRCTRARPLQPIVCCPEFNPTTLASARAPTDPRFDPAGIDIDDLYLAAFEADTQSMSGQDKAHAGDLSVSADKLWP